MTSEHGNNGSGTATLDQIEDATGVCGKAAANDCFIWKDQVNYAQSGG
jgi:hypothetical protein